MLNSQKPTERYLAGAMLMVLAMLISPIAEAAAKFLSSNYSPILLSWMRFTVGAVILLPFAFFMKTEPLQVSKRMVFEQTLRAILIVTGTVLFIVAITQIPLADAFGAYFTAPIIAGILSVFLLGEKFSVIKLMATVLGFVGMILIVRPSPSMEIGFIYALAAGICYGSFMVVTRWSVCKVPSIKVVIFQNLFGALILLPFILLDIETIRSSDTLLFLTLGLASAVANMLAFSALRLAPASFLAPLIYVEIVGATLLGFVVFGDVPAGITLLGIGIIILGGLMLIGQKSSN